MAKQGYKGRIPAVPSGDHVNGGSQQAHSAHELKWATSTKLAQGFKRGGRSGENSSEGPRVGIKSFHKKVNVSCRQRSRAKNRSVLDRPKGKF